MKKKVLSMLLLGAVVCACSGCNTNMSFTYNVDTGDTVKVQLNTTGGYKLSSSLPFEVSKDGEILSQGTFITLDGYYAYYDEVYDSDVEILEDGQKGECEYVMWTDGYEYDYLILIEDSNTGVLIGNDVSEESARECFDRLDITLE